MSGVTVDLNAEPLAIPPEHKKGIRLYFPPVKPNSKLNVQAVIKKFIDEMTALMNSGQLNRYTAIANVIVLLSDLHD